MAIRRYRHFWTSQLNRAAIPTTNPSATQAGTIAPASAGLFQTDIADDTDLSSIIKNYEPPQFLREVREVATGKVVNERILGRLDAPATNFSITLPSEFERFYGYNTDYEFRIDEELHDNQGGRVLIIRDLVWGTMFARESTMYEHGTSDRDWTLRFILRKFTRNLHYPVVSTMAGITTVTNIAEGAYITLIDADFTGASPNIKYHDDVDMFGRNQALGTRAATDI